MMIREAVSLKVDQNDAPTPAREVAGPSLSHVFTNASDFISTRHQTIAIAALLIVLCLSVFEKTFWFAPGEADDLRMLSSVAKTTNPLSYFAGDWGLGLYRQGDRYEARSVYRPFHSVSIWVGYRLFGVRSLPNQLLNLILHLFNILVLLKITGKLGTDPVLRFLTAAIALVSIYTVSPASWISDRPTLIVAAALLLLVDHFLVGKEAAGAVRIPYLIALSFLALINKESGLIVPAFALLFALTILPRGNTSRSKMITASLAVIATYAVARFLIFGTAAGSFSESGYLFGLVQYQDWANLPRHLQAVALVENTTKNFVASFAPVFDSQGGFQLTNPLIWIPTAALSVAAVNRVLSVPQKLAILILLLNAVIHCQVFRYRALYIAVLGFCLFVASSPALQMATSRMRYAQVAGALLLLGSVFTVNQYLHSQWLSRYEQINRHSLSTIIQEYPDKIEPGVAKAVLERYKSGN